MAVVDAICGALAPVTGCARDGDAESTDANEPIDVGVGQDAVADPELDQLSGKGT
jgi:hypothetical protein